MQTIQKINTLLFLTIIFLIYFLVVFNSPYNLETAVTDSGREYVADALSVFIGETQSHYNHPGLIPIWIGSFIIRFFVNDNFDIQNFINVMTLISYTFLILSFYFVIKFYKQSSFKSIIIYPLCLSCFLWPPLIGSLTMFSSYSFLPSFSILFIIQYLYIFQKKKYALGNFLILRRKNIIPKYLHMKI